MKRTFWHRLDVLARQSTPFGLTLILLIIGILPIPAPEYTRIAPLFSVMAVYHWAIHRPDLLPVYSVFLLGLLQDALTGVPLGVNALVLITVYGVVLSQRRFFYGKPFRVAWLGFSLVAAGAAAESWILISAYNLTLITPQPLMIQYLLTLGMFPLLAWFFIRWQRAFLIPET